MNELVMDTGYSFKVSVKTHLFLQEVYDMDIDGVNYFIDDQKEPCGIVILRFKGLADLSRLDEIASKLGGGRMYLPGDWRVRFIDYEFASIESV
jgi:hypothetical protein